MRENSHALDKSINIVLTNSPESSFDYHCCNRLNEHVTRNVPYGSHIETYGESVQFIHKLVIDSFFKSFGTRGKILAGL